MTMNRITTILKSPQKAVIQLSRWVSYLDWRLLLLLILLLPLSLLAFLSLSSSTTSFSSFNPLQSLFHYRTSTNPSISHPSILPPITWATNLNEPEPNWTRLNRTKMAVCLVGGARRFELTGPSIVEKILKVYPNSDLFLHSPFDSNSFKLSLLKIAPRIASVRIFEPKPVPETESELRVLTGSNSPNGIQGLLQYFNLVEGCLTMIKAYQQQNNFTYDWIVRTRVDGYWSAPLSPENFVPGQYLVPPGSSYGGLNDRLGIGDLNTSTVALSRFSLLPKLDSAGFRQLNSETSFRAQLTTQSVPYLTKRLPFCIITDRTYEFPPGRFGVPVAAISSRGPLSGAKCRPCTVVCRGDCVAGVMERLFKGWSWTDWDNGTLELCDAHGEWEKGWERMFDRAAGKKMAAERKRIWGLKMKECVGDFEEMRRRTTGKWEAPAAAEICKLGLGL